jgi:Ca-activated chloride channel family protein
VRAITRHIPFDVFVRLDEPAWAWLLALGAGVTLLTAPLLATLSPVRRASAVLLRLALLGVLVGALAGLSSVRTVDTLAVVAVVDVSGSVRRYFRDEQGRPALDRVRHFLGEISRQRGPDDLLGIVAFDGRAVAILRPRRGEIPPVDLEIPPAEGTNIAQALTLARSLIPPDARGRVILFSDGVQTAGDAIEAARHDAVPVDVVPLEYDLATEVVVERLDAPATAPGGATITLRAVISATVPSSGLLRLLREGEVVDLNGDAPGDALRLDLRPGLTVLPVQVRLGGGRVHRFRAVYEPDTVEGADGSAHASGDTIPENNRADAFTVTPGRGSVLLVDGLHAGEGGTLAATLREAGADVTVVAPEAIPADLLSLQPFDLVILENVPANIPGAAQKALVAYVSDLGGGLVMVGGPDTYAPGGWQGSELEPVLPVLLEVPDVLVAPRAATVFVLDNSGSMSWPVLGTGRSQQEIANDAAALAIRTLDRRDLIGVITFNNQARVLVPLASHPDPGEIIARVRAIDSGGGTNLLPAMELARRELQRAGAGVGVRHVVVLTDGISRNKDRLPEIAESLARDGVRVSTLAVGDGADLNTLRAMAERGGGTYFHAANVTQLPRLLLKAVRIVRSPMIREEPFTPVVHPLASPMTADLGDVPPLGGLVLTRPRPEPTVALSMTTPGGEPVLASWNVGLGRVVAWTSDAENWASEWIDSPAYRRLWSQVLRVASRAGESAGLRAEAEAREGRIALRLWAQDESARPLDALSVSGTLYAPSGAGVDVRLSQTAPGFYEGEGAASETGSYIAVLRPAQGSARLPAVIAGTSVLEGAEYRARSSDPSLLVRVAEQTGGRVLSLGAPSEAGVWDRGGLPAHEALTSLWRPLVVVALVLLMLDIATRRVAWDRWVSRRFGRVEAPASVAGADAALETLRRAHEVRATEDPPAIALGEEDARALAAAARDRRTAERLAGLRSDTGAPVIEEKAPPAAGPDESSLLAAKQRARRRYEEDSA